MTHTMYYQIGKRYEETKLIDKDYMSVNAGGRALGEVTLVSKQKTIKDIFLSRRQVLTSQDRVVTLRQRNWVPYMYMADKELYARNKLYTPKTNADTLFEH